MHPGNDPSFMLTLEVELYRWVTQTSSGLVLKSSAFELGSVNQSRLLEEIVDQVGNIVSITLEQV